MTESKAREIGKYIAAKLFYVDPGRQCSLLLQCYPEKFGCQRMGGTWVEPHVAGLIKSVLLRKTARRATKRS